MKYSEAKEIVAKYYEVMNLPVLNLEVPRLISSIGYTRETIEVAHRVYLLHVIINNEKEINVEEVISKFSWLGIVIDDEVYQWVIDSISEKDRVSEILHEEKYKNLAEFRENIDRLKSFVDDLNYLHHAPVKKV